jgi:methionyl-tRNA formyltransferase
MVRNISILLLCGDTNRAISYLHVLKRLKHIELQVILYGVKESVQNKSEILLDFQTQLYLENILEGIPDINNSIEYYLNEYNLSYSRITERDVNSDKILNSIEGAEAQFVVFAGYGGQILSDSHFKGEKKYIHCHPGWLPQERGSTTLYYSILNDCPLSVTAFFMTAKIDNGEILVRKSFPRPSSLVNIDVFVDNFLRAETLRLALTKLAQERYEVITPNDKNDEEFYIIHPILKHISLLSLKDR